MSGKHKDEIFKALIFNRTTQQAFARELKQAVNSYFTEHTCKRTGGLKFAAKVPVIAAIYLIPYMLIITQTVINPWLLLLLAITMGVGTATIGLVIMHDANHGCASSKAWINKALGYTINFLGGHSVNWKIQHNVLHHTFTNIHGYDEDIVSTSALRLTPHAEWRWYHQFQHIYAPLFYSLLTLHWSGHSDFSQLKRYHNMGLLASQHTTYKREVIKLSISKLCYFVFNIGIPVLFTQLTWWEIGLGFITMHLVAGLILSLVFQSAHVTESAEFVCPESHLLEENSMVHQLQTTRNFATGSKWFTWLVGGLNFQIEHHLFPNISHVHYPAIARLVKQTALKHQLPYYQSTSFFSAVHTHFRFLQELGQRKNTAL